jgi:hypothetical protein
MQGVHQPLPRARQSELVLKEVGGEMLVYDRRNDKAHCLNQAAAFVWSHCDGQITAGEMAEMLGRELNTPVAVEVVWFALDQLRRSSLLAESPAGLRKMNHLPRRVLMKRLGIAAAVAVPLVTSIVAPTAAAAASCLPASAPCVVNSDCCSNNCADNGRGTLNCS